MCGHYYPIPLSVPGRSSMGDLGEEEPGRGWGLMSICLTTPIDIQSDGFGNCILIAPIVC